MHLNQGKKMAEQKFLIIVEGEKAEVEVIKSLENAGLFPIGNQVIAYCGEIHQLFRLYEKLSHDDGLDTIGLLISKNVIAKNSKRDDFSEIYLFFDSILSQCLLCSADSSNALSCKKNRNGK